MMRQYTNELKNYNFLQRLTEGYFVDAKDEGRWKVGRVQQIRKIGHKTCVEIMFDGYSYKYNQTYDIPSYSKLAPFRKFTVPYTGIYGQEPRRQQPNKSLQHYIKLLGKICSDMNSFTSQDINQIVRGQLFIYIDYCLTLSLKQQAKYQFEEYMRLFFVYLEMVDCVIGKVLEFLKEVQKDGNLDQNFIYVYPKMSWLYAVTQFLFNCNSMISKKQQRISFHTYFGRHQSQDAIYASLLGKIKSLNLEQKCQRIMSFKVITGGKSLPWSIKKQMLILIKSINPEEKIVLPKDTKEVIEFLEYLPYFTKKSVISMEEEEKYRNELIFNLIINGNFEGKLIGLNEIKRLITSYSGYKKESTILDLIKSKNLIGFFLDNNNFNSELFKRSLVVFEYAYKNKLFTKEQFPLVLKLHKDKHELQLKNFYSSLAEFGAFFNEIDVVECFHIMIKELPFEENFIDLIRNYTISTIQKNPFFRKIYMNKDEHGFGLIYFWDLINGQGKVNKDLIPKIIESFATLLNNVYYSRQIERFIVSSIKAIKELKNTESFLKVIHESLKLCKGSKMNKAIETAQKQVNVIESAMMMLRQQQNNLSSSGFQNLFEFLEEVNYISRKGLTQSDILFLWKMDKQKCRAHLLKFLRKFKLRSNDEKSQQRIISKSLDLQQIQFIIKNIFESDELMEGYKQIDMDHYDTIDQLILCYLHNKKIVEYNYKHTIRYRKNEFFLDDDKMFLGMSFYLKCIQNNHQKYSQVSTKAIKRLVDIFMRPLKDEFPSKSYNDIKAKNWLRLSKAFDTLKNNRLKCFQVQLVEIYGRMKSLNILSPESLEIRVKEASTNRVCTFNLPRYTSLWKFRCLLNEKFELNNTNFEIQLLEQNTTTNLQREEDLSIAFITLVKERNGVSVVVHPSKDQHPHFKAIDKFKEDLCQMVGQNLYKNLSSQNKQKSLTSLDILLNLPFIKSVNKSIQSLDFKQWTQIIDPNNMSKMEYQLKIIQKVKDGKWIITFLSKGGLKHLAEVVLFNLGKDNYKTLNLLMDFFNQAVQFIMKNSYPFGEQFLKDILFYEKQKSQDYIAFLLNCFILIKHTSAKIKLTSFFEKQKMTQILEYVLFTNKKPSISGQILDICKVNSTFLNLNKHLRAFLNFDYLKNKETQCQPFFEVIRMLIEKGQLTGIAQQLQKLLLEVRNSDIKEKSENQVNQLLLGYLSCVYELVKVNRLEDVFAQKKEKFFMHLLKECLFHPQNIASRKFKSKQLRSLGFKFLEFLQFETKKDNEIDKLLIPMMAKGSWRKQFEWGIEPIEFVNKKFTGIKNLAATCYMNSLLQQLFYIKNFSSQLMSIDSDKIQDKENIVRQLQNIFGFLKYSQNPSYTTASMCQNFILDGQPIDPRIQTDVDEFFHALMDKLERNLEKINKKDIINEVFGGQFSNMIIGQECPHASERIEHFLSIRLEIKNKKTIYQALDQFIKGQILEGENSYFCQKCDKKVKALKRVCLKDLPPVMIVTLKRFQFDYDTMEKFKLNTYCSFPQNINFLPYTKQGLQEDSDAKKQDYEYKLKGVIIHYGVSQAGHYTSYVRTDDKNWSYFDDERISEFGLEELQNECFGGIEENPFGDDEEKKKNAYLLIYEKIKATDELKEVPEQVLAQSKVYQLVEQDNVKTKMVNLLFEPNIENYIYNLSEINPKVFLIYYHTVFLRSARKHDKYTEFYTKCSQLLSKKQIAEWYLRQITESFLMEFVIFGEYEAKYIVTSLICQAMKLAVDIEFMQQCVALLSTKMMMPFVKIFSAASVSHPEYAKYLTGINLGEVILNLIKGKEIKETSVIKKAQTRKYVSEFGVSASSFIERRIFDPKDLLQAIESFKTGLSLEEIKQLATSVRSKRTLKSLAMMTARKYKDLDQLKKFIETFLSSELYNFEPKTGEQAYYGFLIQVVEEMCKIVDKEQQQRIMLLGKLYADLMRQAIIGFRCQVMLLNSFFRIALTNKVFRNVIAVILNDKDYKKVVQALKEWIKDLPNVITNIKSQKWGWWRKPKSTSGLTTQDVNNEVKPSIKEALSLLNSIIEKHPIEDVQQFLEVDNIGYIEQKYGPEYVKITRKIGFLVEYKDDSSNHKFISEDEIIKKFV